LRTLAYTVHDAHSSPRRLTSAPAALALWVALIASNLWWLHQSGAVAWPSVVQRMFRSEVVQVSAAHQAGDLALARQRHLKLDADGAF